MSTLIYALLVGSVVIVAVYALAVARITRMITEDRIFDAARDAVLKRLPDDSLLAYLLLCPWCVSVWVASPAAVVAYFWGTSPWALIPAAALAFSYVAGFLAAHEGG